MPSSAHARSRPPKPSGSLALDAAAPLIDVTVAGVAMRLRVDMDQQDSVELNPAAAQRLAVPWEDGLEMDVGRVRLASRIAPAVMQVDGRAVPVTVSTHGRDCCRDADGAIGPDELPFAFVRWLRAAAPAPTGAISLPLAQSTSTGLSAPSAIEGVRLRFALGRAETVGTAAAGGTLAQRWGGRWGGAETRSLIAFDIARPVRAILFDRPGLLAGFRIASLPVRISDFGGDQALPADPIQPGDLVVTRHLTRQHAWPIVTIGRDRLSRCADITYAAQPRSLTLHCAFDR